MYTNIYLILGNWNLLKLSILILPHQASIKYDIKDSLYKKIWKNYCNHINESVSFKQNGNKQSGIFKGLNNDGKAIIQIDAEEILFNSITLD